MTAFLAPMTRLSTSSRIIRFLINNGIVYYITLHNGLERFLRSENIPMSYIMLFSFDKAMAKRDIVVRYLVDSVGDIMDKVPEALEVVKPLCLRIRKLLLE